MNHLLRRSASIAAATAANRSLAATILSSELLLHALSSLPSQPAAAATIHTSCASAVALENRIFTSVPRRALHFSAGPVGFRVTDAAHAAAALEDSYDEVADEGLEISKLGIAQEIVDLLGRKGITQLFPIQKAVLQPAMQGRDMIGRAKTGTGKTLAFGIPILDKIIHSHKKHGKGKNPLALVLAPTRELARQVEKEFKESAPVDTLCAYGGIAIQQQMRILHYGVDVVVGTPGRVIDLLNRGALVLSEVQFVVLDEADEMLNVGFAEEVEKILEKLPLQRQSLMFSATMPPSIRNLTRKYLKDPLIIDLVGENDQKLAEGITLYSIASNMYSKASILVTLIKEHANGGKCIVFTERKRDADQLAYSMSRSLNCRPLHGDITQVQRERTLSGFRDGTFNVLVATDVAARGLDVPNVDLVIHYELPKSSEIFVHRSGRTGRAGKKGSVIIIYSQEQSRLVRGIEQDTGGKFTELPKITVEGGDENILGGGIGGRFNSYGGQSPGGGSGGYNNGRPRSYGGSGGYGSPSSGGAGGYGGSGNGRFGSGSAGGGYGSSGFGRSTGYGSPGQGSFGSSSGFGRSTGYGSSSGFGRSTGYGSPGQGSLGSFPESTGSFGNSWNSGQRYSDNLSDPKANRYGGFGLEGTSNSWPGSS